MIYYPLFRVRSWNNGMRRMFLYIFILIYILNLGYSAGEFTALQLVLLVASGAVDESLASSMMVHFRVFGFQK